MSDCLSALAPRSLWDHFASILAIPRPSKHEERMVAWIRSLAEQHGFVVVADEVGNLVVRVEGSQGRQQAPTVVLQAHLDMVCEKNQDTEHDFMQDPIRPRIEGEWVYATGTTLGADNGIGVAAALAAATDPEVQHGPLELLFTLDEETGLTGAQHLDGSLLEGRTLINMDSEEDGKLFVGCAGGADCHLWLDLERREVVDDRRALRITVSGLRGGHSGLNIHENRGNALRLLTRLLSAAIEDGVELDLADLAGGNMHNAIPREAGATVLVPSGGEERLRAVLDRMLEGFRAELSGVDEGLQISIAAGTTPPTAWIPAARDRLLNLLSALPHGVLAMSPDVPGLVETSSNLAVVETLQDRVRVITSSRSSVNSMIAATVGTVVAAGRLAGAEVEVHDGYPGWKPDMDSAVLQVARRVYQNVWAKPPEVTAVHAGLECGLLGEKVPGLDMISFGPEIQGAHSPDERVQIPSVERFWQALSQILAALSS